jgi:hypothetical protein
MFSTKRHNSHVSGLSARRVLQTWLMAFVILFAGVTQSGLVPALLSGQATGISAATAAEIGPDSDYLLICTPSGIKLVSLAELEGDASDGADATDRPDDMAGHAFCPLCANHHGAVVSFDTPEAARITKLHELAYATAFDGAWAYEIPRIRHSRAPPSSV